MTLYRKLVLIVALAAPLVANAASDSRLIDAVKHGDIDAIRSFIKDKSIDVNAAQSDGTTALHWAAHKNDLETAGLLLDAGANASPANVYNVTPLHLACTNHSNEMGLRLIKAGAKADAALWTGETVLMECSRTGATATVAALIKAGANVSASETSQGQTALMWAAGMGHTDIVKLLLKHGADVNAKTLATADKVPNTCRICTWKSSPGGFTALMFAARSGDVESARLLLTAGADPDAATEEDGNTLVVASASGHEEVALLLLKNGADFESKDDNGVTALHYALYNGLSRIHGYTYDPVYRVRPANMPKLAKALLEAGADPNAKIVKNYSIGPEIRGNCDSMTGTAGATPFLLAAASADAALLSLLAKFEADIHLAKEDGTTALIAAARSACTLSHQRGDLSNAEEVQQALEAVKVLVELGTDVNGTDESGNTAIHMAAFSGADAVVQYLAQRGANVNASNKNSETPWSMASGISPSLQSTGSYGTHETTASLLLSLGAKPVERDKLVQQEKSANTNVSIIRDPSAGDVEIK